jgi:hypothetical protein
MSDSVKKYHEMLEDGILPKDTSKPDLKLTLKTVKDLNYWKNNCEEDYIKTPISVLRYIGELEKELEKSNRNVL